MAAMPMQNAIKTCNITLVADGLYTSILHAQFFPEMDPAKKVVQIPQIAVLEFDKYSFAVDVEGRRTVATDKSQELATTSPIVTMMKRFVQEAKSISIKAIGFNYVFELRAESPTVDFLTQFFLRLERFKTLGKSIRAAGFKVVTERDDGLLQVTFDPDWNEPKVASLHVNYHYDNPGQKMWSALIDRFAESTVDAPKVVDCVTRS